MSEFYGKRILILGMARSGIAAAELLIREGADVTVSDLKALSAFKGALDGILSLGARNALGHDVTEEELRGQDLLVVSPGVPLDASAVKLAGAMNVPVIGEMEMAARLIPGEMLAITGTNGKTTTVTLLGEMFKAAGRRSFVCGNIGYPISAAAMEVRAQDMTVAEVSSFQLETMERFHPVSAAVLNVTEDHLIRHGTMERYIELKRSIFDRLEGRNACVLNADDPICADMAEGLKGRVLFFSRKKEPEEGAFVRDGRMVIRLDGREETICETGEIYIPGPHNLENALAASLLAYERGVPAGVIRETLRTFRGVEHRIEFVRELDGVRYINDSKGTNADSTVKAIEAMTRPTVLILGGYDKHVSFDPLAASVVASPWIRYCVLIGATADQIEAALKNAGYRSTVRASSLEEAVKTARELCGHEDNVLLSPACASFDMFSDYEQRGRVFKQIVSELE